MENKNPLAGGFYFDKPHEKAPEFVKGRISIKADEAIETIKKYTNEHGYVRLELLKKKDGSGHYLQVNTYGLDKTEPQEDDSVPF